MKLPKRIKNIIRKIRYSLHVTSRIFGKGAIARTCPCCGYQGRFDTVGDPPRYNALCPACSSFERHRLLTLVNHEQCFFLEKDVLHFAPEPVLSRIIKTQAKRYLTADLMAENSDCILDIEQIDQPSESWDVILCSHVLEHVNDDLALRESYRILREDGLLLVIAPIIEGWDKTYENINIASKQDRDLHFGQSDHVRYFGRDIRARIKNAGFSIFEYTAYGPDVVQYGLLRGEKVFACKKTHKN